MLPAQQFDEVVQNGVRVLVPHFPFLMPNTQPKQCVVTGASGIVGGSFACGPVVNPLDFGALGNSTADDSAAMNAALQYVATGGKVQLPCGNFRVDTVQNAPNGNRSILYEPNVSNVEIAGSGDCTRIYSTTLNKSVFEFLNGSNIVIHNLRVGAVNGTYVENFGWAGGSAIKLSNVSGCHIYDLKIDGASAGGVYLTNGTNNCLVEGNRIGPTWSMGINEDDCTPTTNANCGTPNPPFANKIVNNFLSDAGYGGAYGSIVIDTANATTGTHADGNTCRYPTAPVNSTTANLACVNVNGTHVASVSNNDILATPGPGIAVVGNSSVPAMIGNTIQNPVAQCFSLYWKTGSTLSGVNIIGGSCTASGADGLVISGDSDPTTALYGITVSSVLFSGVGTLASGTYSAINFHYGFKLAAFGNSINGLGTVTKYGINVGTTTSSVAIGPQSIFQVTTAAVNDPSQIATNGEVAALPSLNIGSKGSGWHFSVTTGGQILTDQSIVFYNGLLSGNAGATSGTCPQGGLWNLGNNGILSFCKSATLTWEQVSAAP